MAEGAGRTYRVEPDFAARQSILWSIAWLVGPASVAVVLYALLLAATLLAPIVYVVGNLPVFRGVTDLIASGFYQTGLMMLWFLPAGLAVAYYVVPVETGNPLYSGALARAGFWSLIFAGGWTG